MSISREAKGFWLGVALMLLLILVVLVFGGGEVR